MSSVKIQLEPLNAWAYPQTLERTHPPFTARYEVTLDVLDRELFMLGATTAALHVVTHNGAADMRRDGLLRATARPSHPGVAVDFMSKFGPMTMFCDSYESHGARPSWQANLRAIALTLEKLRAVDRYGVGGATGKQYTGWLQIEAGAADVDRDWARLAEIAGIEPSSVTSDILWKRAVKAAHPDRHAGRRELWDEVEQLGHRLNLTKEKRS